MGRKVENVEWKRKQLNYFCRNETRNRILEIRNRRKKAIITYYSDTSPTMMPKGDEHQYCSKNVATLGLPALLYQPGVHTNLEVIVLYTQVKVMVMPFVIVQLAGDH